MSAAAGSLFSIKVHLAPVAARLQVEALQTLQGSVVKARSKAQLGPVLLGDVAGVPAYGGFGRAAGSVLVCVCKKAAEDKMWNDWNFNLAEQFLEGSL